MASPIEEVLNGQRRWHIECADASDFLRSLPDRSLGLVVTSPPYEDARTYGIGFRLKGQAWVDWMAGLLVEACRVTDGLVLLNAAGRVRNHRYQPVIEWLVADLTRQHGIVCGPAPYCYFRYGVPGSGGAHYHRRDWEPVYAFCLPDRLPLRWSDNTAMGQPPRWAPGGAMSHRLSDGTRVNQWGGHETSGRTRKKSGAKQSAGRPSHQFEQANGSTRRQANGSTRRRQGSGKVEPMTYTPPTIANPGNVVAEQYTAVEVQHLLLGGELDGPVMQGSPGGDVVRCVVGGNAMGSKAAHKSEAPFSARLVEYFVRSYCPPDGIVGDLFTGSGTTAQVAIEQGRRFLGSEIRPEQVDIASRRVECVTPPLPGLISEGA